MAKFKNNNLVFGLSGKFGPQMVFRQYRGTTLLCVPGEVSGEATEKQMAVRDRFADAAVYGKTQMGDPVAKAYYQECAKEIGYPSAYIAATTDYLNPPVIASVDMDMYLGEIGDPIEIKVIDKFKVASVSVTIQRADGSIIETGKAVQMSESAWIYTSTVAEAGTKVIVKATDKPGNVVTKLA